MDGNGNDTSSGSQFNWTVMDDIGCFLLGNKPDITDDLYVLSIIIVGARSFEKLISGRMTSESEGLTFQITSECFGVAYEGEEFKLGHDPNDPNHLTYCGDRCTARIRCSSSEFTRFLKGFTMIMNVNVRKDELADWEAVGQAHIPFSELLQKPEINKTYEVYFDGPANPNSTIPSLQVNLDYTKSPKYFENVRQPEEGPSREVSICTSKQNLLEIGAGDAPAQNYSVEQLTNSFRDRLEIVGVGTSTAQTSVRQRNEDVVPSISVQAPTQASFPVEIVTQVDSRAKQSLPAATTSEPAKDTCERSDTSKKTPSSIEVQVTTAPGNSKESKSQGKVRKPASEKAIASSAFVAKHKPNAAYEDALMRFTPGLYRIRFFFKNASLKTRSKVERTWNVVLFHDVFGVSEDDRTEIPTKSYHDEANKLSRMNIEEEEIWQLEIPQLTLEMLETPIELLLRPAGVTSKPVRCVAELPIGEAFIGFNGDRFWKEYNLKIWYVKPGSRLAIGTLVCTLELSKNFEDSGHVTLQPPSEDRTLETSCVPETPRTVHKTAPPETPLPRNSIDMVAYEREFKEQLKAKEEAFLKMLSDEYKKQTDDNEAAMKKMHEMMEQKKASYDEKLRDLESRETELRRKEIALDTKQRKTTLDAKQMIQEYELKYKKLEAEKNIEIEALKQRLKSALSEAEIAKSRIKSVEAKLKEQREEMELFKSQNLKDVAAAAQGKIFIQENVQLKKDLKKVREDRDRFKQQVDAEQQKRLQNENDLLRSQMYRTGPNAAVQHDRRTFSANPSRVLKETNVTQPSRLNNITVRQNAPRSVEAETQNHPSPRSVTDAIEQEITRLTNLKAFLLNSLCYRTDSEVIADIEGKILEYRQQQNSSIS